MALRHQVAVKAIQEANLYQLATYLVTALNDCAEQRVMPHTDAAIQVIGYQIAFASNGDIPDHEYYFKLARYCSDNQDEATPPAPPEPPYKFS